jgi:hypothetical protein
LRFHSLDVGNLLHLSALTSLQVLHLDVAGANMLAVGPSSVPGLVFPTFVKALHMSYPLEAALQSLLPTGLQELQIDCDVRGPLEGPGSFLSCMARLQQLTSFVMGSDGAAMDGDVIWPLPCPAYSAFTTSSSLVRLQLHNPPGGIWQDVLPATRTLPHLTSFSITPCDDGFTDHRPFWNPGDFVSLISCCPILCSIDSIPVQHGAHVSRLAAAAHAYASLTTSFR